jgi:SulP family sulfate permease
LDLKLQSTDSGILLKVKGTLFFASIGQLTDIFHSHAKENITVDLQYTTHIDQSAVDFFSRESKNLSSQGGKLTLLINEHQCKFLKNLGVCGDIELVSQNNE